jgi:hypothetical protein
MIRLRDDRGKATELPEAQRFIEVCDLEGAVAMVIHRRSDGAVVIYNPQDLEFRGYCEVLGLRVSQVLEIHK